MTETTTIVARLVCGEQTPARRIAAYLDESLDASDTVCSAFEADDGQWQVAMYFSAPPNEAEVRALVAAVAGNEAAAALDFDTVDAKDWVAESLSGLVPVRAGRFIVHGAHDRTRVRPNDIDIEIEAALAFGTGHHGTTRGCLVALDRLAKSRRFRHVLDLGTGSGVLAIAAAKIFHAHVLASDIDRVAVTAAKGNCRLNGTGSRIAPIRAVGTHARAFKQKAPFDLIFANILLGPLLRLAVPVTRLAGRNARIVLSGLLPGHANAVLAIYRAQGFTLERRIALEGWVTLVLKRLSFVPRKKRNRPGGETGRFRR